MDLKTMGTKDSHWIKVKHLIETIDKYYPSTSIHIGTDSGKDVRRDETLRFLISNRNSSKSLFLHFLPEDSGLSVSRNFLVRQVQTPFVFYLDDDFYLGDDSHLDLLFQILIENPSVDLIAGKIPQDILSYQDYSGIFLHYNRTLELTHRNSTTEKHFRLFKDQKEKFEKNSLISSCVEVDFVPNVFLARKSSLEMVQWKNDLKTGEHEEFFLRFRQANRTVRTCRFINVHHDQYLWWINRTDPYFHRRSRVYHYLRQMLFEHKFNRLIAFNYVHVDFTRFPFNQTERKFLLK